MSHRRRGFTLPILALAGFVPFGYGVWTQRNETGGIPEYLSRALTGYSPNNVGGYRWHWNALVHTWGPIALGIIGHKIIGGRLGVNRALASAGVPFFRL